ncbi:MAG TPA: J domain-containing protein [Lysobacter sp.]|nr:J domain-containing protein [Lysobacter sp.]
MRERDDAVFIPSLRKGDGGERPRPDFLDGLELPPADHAVRPWHEVLRVEAPATSEEIEVAYRRLIDECDPDRLAGTSAEVRDVALQRSREIQAAYAQGMLGRGRYWA